MDKLDKVIKGLEWIIDLFSNYERHAMSDEEMQSLNDAIVLLKAQQPRVMTWEEAKTAEVCWLEQRGYEPFATFEVNTWNPEKYGESYRCWNRMPTDEQRRAVKWDGQIG